MSHEDRLYCIEGDTRHVYVCGSQYHISAGICSQFSCNTMNVNNMYIYMYIIICMYMCIIICMYGSGVQLFIKTVKSPVNIFA